MHNNYRVIVLLLILDGIILLVQLRKESVLQFLSLLRSEIELLQNLGYLFVLLTELYIHYIRDPSL